MKKIQTLKSNSLSRLTFTRFIAALIVVIFHFGSSLWPFNTEAMRWFAQQGPIAVSYFYCLSGFIMAVAYPAAENQTLDKSSFWVARFARIYPCFLLSIAFGTYYYSEATLRDTVEILVGLQPWVADRLSHANPPAWSIGVEAFFYLLFPFTIVFFTKARIKIAAVFVTALWIGSMVLSANQVIQSGTAHDAQLSYFNLYNPLMHLNEFFLGVLVGSVLSQRTEKPFNLLHPVIPLLVLCGILISRSSYGIPNLPGVHFANGALAPVFIWLIASIATSKEHTLTIFNNRFLILLGEASYAMYVLHYPLRLWFITNTPQTLKDNPLTELFTYCIVLTMVSICVHLAIEAPLRTILRKLLSKPKAQSALIADK